jgi:hypothetical protein
MLMHDAADLAITADIRRVAIMVAAMMLGEPPPGMAASVAFFATDNDRVVRRAWTVQRAVGLANHDRIVRGTWAMQVLPATHVIAVTATTIMATAVATTTMGESAIGRDHQENRCRRDGNDTSRP